MSRLGKKPVDVPSGAKVSVDGQTVNVEGPKGKLAFTAQPAVDVKVDGSQVVVTRKDDQRPSKAFHGLTRALVQNMVVGVTQGYRKALEVQGVGYNATLKGKKIELAVGFANKITKDIPDGVEVKVDGGTKIEITGPDKQKVGQLAAEIRSVRKPEPYKGKGIRYEGEQVKMKEGKTAGK
jgi:large subunit ribosomal protein L6